MVCQGQNWHGENILSSSIPQLIRLSFRWNQFPGWEKWSKRVFTPQTVSTAQSGTVIAHPCPSTWKARDLSLQKHRLLFFLTKTDWQCTYMGMTERWWLIKHTRETPFSTWPKLMWKRTLATVSPWARLSARVKLCLPNTDSRWWSGPWEWKGWQDSIPQHKPRTCA